MLTDSQIARKENRATKNHRLITENMGRKSAKGKERRQRRKEENAKMAASQGKVDAANKLEDPMAMLEPFKKFERNGLSLTIECKRVTDLDMDTIEWAFDLTKKNMQALYESCDFGWKDRDKREEMTEDKAWYLIVRDQEKKPVAFIHFRFDIEIDVEVVYCYEIQLIEGVRRKGLGKFLMQILELMAYKTEMKKVMMTTFKHNTDSVDFFRKGLKYEVDEISPDDPVFDEGYCYWILSKTIQPKKSSAKNSHGASGTVGNVTNGHCHSEGGLGDAVCSAVSECRDIVVKKLAVLEVPRSGKPTELVKKYGISSDCIKKAVHQILDM